MKNAITIVATILIAVGCGDDGSERSSIAVESDNTFWKLIHNPEDQNFDDVIVALESAVEEDPEDAYSVAHLGWAHFWAFAEGTARGTVAPETAIDHMKSAETSFTTAVALAPEEPRIRGFLGYTRQALGQATQDQNVLDQSRADISASVTMWPEWALFGAAYGPDAAPASVRPLRASGRKLLGQFGCLCQQTGRPRKSRLDAIPRATDPRRKRPSLLGQLDRPL